ncbi:sigma-70 family RNA polymerase sigma factor [Porticoccaceae bacterium LTM1]|nr:sigma-70 family RNA polymerase sigma factor [Porticoccaceae bacterium LTM1]
MSKGLGSVVKLVKGREWRNKRQLERLFGEHSQALLCFIRQRAELCGFDPEDLVQEVFTRLASSQELMDKIKDGLVNTRPYLFQMANNLLVDMVRRSHSQAQYVSAIKQEGGESHTGGTELGPEAVVIAQRDLEVLKKVIMDLKPTWREAFLLNRFENLSYPEIANRMGVTRKQVENFMARALIRIRRAQEKLDRSQ